MTKKILLGLAFLLTLLTAIGLWYRHYVDDKIECVGNIDWNIGSRTFSGTISMRMNSGTGLAVLNGKLRGEKTTDVSRSIYFSYTRQGQARVLQTMQIVKTFSDTANEEDLQRTLPGFYQQLGSQLSVRTKEYRGAWLFATSNVPSLYCRKSAHAFSF